MNFQKLVLETIPHFDPMRPGYYFLAAERAKTMTAVEYWEAWERRVVYQFNAEHAEIARIDTGADWTKEGQWWSDNFATILLLSLLRD